MGQNAVTFRVGNLAILPEGLEAIPRHFLIQMPLELRHESLMQLLLLLLQVVLHLQGKAIIREARCCESMVFMANDR